jgi:uncharacterized protein (DUF1778 family)
LNGQEIKRIANTTKKGADALERFKKKKDKAIILKIENDLKEALRGWAEAEGVTMSEFVRTLLLEEAERRTKKQNKV